jgi:hypothetical protein
MIEILDAIYTLFILAATAAGVWAVIELRRMRRAGGK